MSSEGMEDATASAEERRLDRAVNHAAAGALIALAIYAVFLLLPVKVAWGVLIAFGGGAIGYAAHKATEIEQLPQPRGRA